MIDPTGASRSAASNAPSVSWRSGSIRVLDRDNDTPIERTARRWDRGPSLAGMPRLSVVLAPGRAALALRARF